MSDSCDMNLRRLLATFLVALCAAPCAISAESAAPGRYRIATVDGAYRVVGPDGVARYLSGVAPVGRRDHMRLLKYLGIDLCHLWPHDPLPLDLVRSAHANGIKVALFVPLLREFRATYHNGEHSGDGYAFGNQVVAAVPDFYNPEWQRLFAARLRERKAELGEALASVALLWLTNEPEIYYGKGRWDGPDFCIADPHTQAAFRRVMEQQYTTLDALNRAWSEAGYRYAFTSWEDFEARALDELFRDWDAPPLTPGAARDLHQRFVPRWLNDWQRIAARIIREEAGLTTGPSRMRGWRNSSRRSPLS